MLHQSQPGHGSDFENSHTTSTHADNKTTGSERVRKGDGPGNGTQTPHRETDSEHQQPKDQSSPTMFLPHNGIQI